MRALLQDARSREASAASAREQAERSHATTTEKHGTAVAAHTAKPEDDGLADAVSRAAVRVQATRTALDTAAKVHVQAQADVAEAEQAVAQAEAAHKRATLEGGLDATREKLHDLGALLGQQLIALRETTVAARALLVADAADVAEAQRLGSTAMPTDGLPIAAGLGEALLAAGGDVKYALGAGSLRWLTEGLQPSHGSGGDVDAFVVGLAQLARALSRPGGPQSDVRRDVDFWRGHRTSGESNRARAAAERPAAPPHLDPMQAAELRRLDEVTARAKAHPPGLIGEGGRRIERDLLAKPVAGR